MNILERLRLFWLFDGPQLMQNPTHRQMRKVRGKRSKPSRITGGRYTRQFFRNQQRRHRAYYPGKVGPSELSQRIKGYYGTFISRRERRKLARATRTPLRLFYNGR